LNQSLRLNLFVCQTSSSFCLQILEILPSTSNFLNISNTKEKHNTNPAAELKKNKNQPCSRELNLCLACWNWSIEIGLSCKEILWRALQSFKRFGGICQPWNTKLSIVLSDK
jgi:hypothetical protein